MKKAPVIALLFIVLSFVACDQKELTAPSSSATKNAPVLAKNAACPDDATYLGTSNRFTTNDLAAAFWPPSPLATNLVIWYFGGIYPSFSPEPQAFIPGFAVLNGGSDCWTTQPFKVIITLRKRGANAATVSPELSVIDDDNSRLLHRFRNLTTSFTTMESGVLPAGTRKLKFLFFPNNINLSGSHADVNIDLQSVVISAE